VRRSAPDSRTARCAAAGLGRPAAWSRRAGPMAGGRPVRGATARRTGGLGAPIGRPDRASRGGGVRRLRGSRSDRGEDRGPIRPHSQGRQEPDSRSRQHAGHARQPPTPRSARSRRGRSPGCRHRADRVRGGCPAGAGPAGPARPPSAPDQRPTSADPARATLLAACFHGCLASPPGARHTPLYAFAHPRQAIPFFSRCCRLASAAVAAVGSWPVSRKARDAPRSADIAWPPVRAPAGRCCFIVLPGCGRIMPLGDGLGKHSSLPTGTLTTFY
jgi:hypothetical protein